jgi:endonuclease/exonuclease/phosphatase family metal-dependent hydrolase
MKVKAARVKIVQLNIWYGILMPKILRFFDRQQADVLCLQEVRSSPDASIEGFDNLELIQKKFNFPHVYYAPTYDFMMMDKRVYFGNCILSRHPITHKEAVFAGSPYKADYKSHQDDPNVRNFQHAIIECNGKSYHVINHHGYFMQEHKHGCPETEQRMKVLHDYIAKLDGSVILTGDLNVLPDSRSLVELNKTLDNLCIMRNVETTRNVNAKTKIEICDYIFVNDKVAVKDFQVCDDHVSDHLALVLECE